MVSEIMFNLCCLQSKSTATLQLLRFIRWHIKLLFLLCFLAQLRALIMLQWFNLQHFQNSFWNLQFRLEKLPSKAAGLRLLPERQYVHKCLQGWCHKWKSYKHLLEQSAGTCKDYSFNFTMKSIWVKMNRFYLTYSTVTSQAVVCIL